MVTVVVVNGKPGCGKTTFENFCQEFYGDHCVICSTIDVVKDIAKQHYGWDGVKTPESRLLLSRLKKELTEKCDLPFKSIEQVYKEMSLGSRLSGQDGLLFVDCREPVEIHRLKEAFDATTVLVRRPGDEETNESNSSDSGVFNYAYDLTISNSGSIMHLRNIAKAFVRDIKGEDE